MLHRATGLLSDLGLLRPADTLVASPVSESEVNQ